MVTTVSALDRDAGNTFTYSLTNNAGGRFAIGTGTGQITVNNSSLLDFEASTVHTVVVQATDQGGLSYARTLTINVSNVNEAPIDVVSARPQDQGVTINSGTSNNQYFLASDGGGLLGGLTDFTIRGTLAWSRSVRISC